jgi:16S rRNA (guanine966-N2)-methyltransferase
MMRVIAGSARRLQLKTIDGKDTRPTTDRIKETLFNMLNPYLDGAVFVDLFSGSGAIAIESLSRGAKQAYLSETNKKAIACIKENLEHTHLAESAEVLSMDALSAVRQLAQRGVVADFIYMDPPYHLGIEPQMLAALADSSLVTADTVVIFEADLHTDFSFVEQTPFLLTRVKEYKTNKHIFLKKA